MANFAKSTRSTPRNTKLQITPREVPHPCARRKNISIWYRTKSRNEHGIELLCGKYDVSLNEQCLSRIGFTCPISRWLRIILCKRATTDNCNRCYVSSAVPIKPQLCTAGRCRYGLQISKITHQINEAIRVSDCLSELSLTLYVRWYVYQSACSWVCCDVNHHT